MKQTDKRKIVAIFELDEFLGGGLEGKITPKENIGSEGLKNYFNQECGWLVESGIYLKDAAVIENLEIQDWKNYVANIIDKKED